MRMLVDEIISSIEIIQDPYLKAATYAKIGERLVAMKDEHFKLAFTRALENANSIEDPPTMFKALLAVGYSLKKVGIKSANRIFQQVLEGSRLLGQGDRDLLMHTAAKYMVAAGDIGGAIIFAMEIQNLQLKDITLLEIIKRNTSLLERDQIKIAYRLRKSRLALDNITLEPYRSKAYLELIKIHLHLGSYEKAITMIEEIERKPWAKLAFKEVVFHLKDRDALSQYIPVLEQAAHRLSKKFGEDFLVEMGRAFALSGATEPAVNLIRKFGGGMESLSEIALTLIEKNPRALPGFIDALSSEEMEVIGKDIMNHLLEHPERGNPEIIGAIERKSPGEEVLVKIVRYRILKGDIDGARRTAAEIKDRKLRSIALTDVANYLLKENSLSEAIDAALEVKDPRFSSILISEILLRALDNEITERKVRE
ncbi:prenyltransferase [Thermococcus sp.]